MVKKKDDFGNVDKSAKIELHIVLGRPWEVTVLFLYCVTLLKWVAIEFPDNIQVIYMFKTGRSLTGDQYSVIRLWVPPPAVQM